MDEEGDWIKQPNQTKIIILNDLRDFLYKVSDNLKSAKVLFLYPPRESHISVKVDFEWFNVYINEGWIFIAPYCTPGQNIVHISDPEYKEKTFEFFKGIGCISSIMGAE